MKYTVEAFNPTTDEVRWIDSPSTRARAVAVRDIAEKEHPDEVVLVCVFNEEGDEVDRF